MDIAYRAGQDNVATTCGDDLQKLPAADGRADFREVCFPLLYRHLLDIDVAGGKQVLGRRTAKSSAALGNIEDVIEFGKNSVQPVRIFEIRAESKREKTVAVATSVRPTRQGKRTIAELNPGSAVIFFGSKRQAAEKTGRVIV